MKYAVFSLLLFAFFACKQEPTEQEELLDYSGKITVYNKSLGGLIDSIEIIDGKGHYTPKSTDGLVANLTLPEVDQHFAHYMVLEEGTVEISITKDSVILFGGTPNNILLGELASKTEPLRLKIHKLQDEDFSHLDSLKQVEEREKNLTEIREYAKEWKRLEREFALEQDNYAGLVFVRKKMGEFSMDQIDQLLTQYGAHKDHEVYQSLERYYAAAKATAVGVQSPSFQINDNKGKSHKLEDYQGNVTLLDFWASWCVPCRKEIPHLKELYEEYHKQGFNIVSISVDDDLIAWRKAMKEENMPWDQLIDEQDEVAKTYYVRSIPRLFLLDAEGKIIGKDLRGEKLTNKLAEVFE